MPSPPGFPAGTAGGDGARGRPSGPPSRVLWSALGEVLGKPSRVIAESERRRLRSIWEEVSERERRLEDRLFLGIIGGTGVGKSTLINAIARASISATGERRPTTARVVVYRHRSVPLPPDFPRADLAEPEAVHEEAALERTVVFDFPDFDSVDADHAAVLSRLLPRLDVLLVVVDDEKYADLRLYQVLRAIPQAARNVHFVLNKVDVLEMRYPGRWRSVADEILEDLGGKLSRHLGLVPEAGSLIAVGARAAFEARVPSAAPAAGAAAQEGDFPAVLDLLEGYRVEKRRRAARLANLEARKEALVGAVRAAGLDAARASRAREARRTLEERRAELDRVLAAIEPEAIGPRELRRLQASALKEAGARLGFPLGRLLSLAAGRKEPPAVAAAELSASCRAHYRPYREMLRAAARELGEEVAALTGEAPAGGKDRADPAEGVERGEALLRDVSARLARSFRRGRLRGHLLPASIVLLAVWAVIHPVIAQVVRDLSDRTPIDWTSVAARVLAAIIAALSPLGILVFLALLALAYLLGAATAAGKARRAVEGGVAACEQSVREAFRREGNETLDGIARPLDAWEAERREIAEAVGGSI